MGSFLLKDFVSLPTLRSFCNMLHFSYTFCHMCSFWFPGATFAVMRCTRRVRLARIAPPEGNRSGAIMDFVVSTLFRFPLSHRDWCKKYTTLFFETLGVTPVNLVE